MSHLQSATEQGRTDSLLSILHAFEQNGALALRSAGGVQQDVGSDNVAGLSKLVLEVLPRGCVGQLDTAHVK